ncbi:MAG: dephospho-CoA kinase [Neisseria sp.]|nr:dephospho-CoA kinase [Neisseria sp.]
MTFWIGLTGGIGSGKSSVAAEFSCLGVPLIDADAVSRSLTQQGGAALPEIRKTFGDAVFDGETLNRAALRDTVFRNPAARQQLENLMFPLILQGIAAEQQRLQAALYGIIEIPLLAENPRFQKPLHRVLLVDAPREERISRVMARSGLSADEVERIMAAQADDAARRAIADDILQNGSTLEEAAEKVRRLHRFYRARFSFLQRNHNDSI